jgi:hypothetical protein
MLYIGATMLSRSKKWLPCLPPLYPSCQEDCLIY